MRRLTPSWIRVPVIFFIIVGLVEYFVDSGDQPAFIAQPIILLFLVLVLIILIGVEAIIASMENILYQSMDEEAKVRYDTSKVKTPKLFIWIRKIYLKLLDSKPIEQEGEIILDHDYDGIQELDNNLPPWWLYGFYATIIFAAVYLLRFHVFNGSNQYDELKTEYANAEKAIAEYKKTAKDLVDINTVEQLTDATSLANGKKIFMTNCIPCHKADGGGGIGPNLTDKYWILGGGIKNVFHTISEGGRDGKGMIAWSKSGLKPSDIEQVASYVLSLQGTTPAEPKEPQGELWVEESPETPTENATQEMDSTAVDSTAVEMK
ncbi:MAG TPA: cbb3-type cytochrome c oxidase N-terminal domain-containing protein [Flavobacteriaceae bacterium]|nr:cbb3-type cytochrome c oxidase N-terminal domain-containing protein [Flavobacteriaceae bacterium]